MSDFDFLIATLFRYAPYPEGSRFRRAGQAEGVFYGSETPETAIVEMAFYRQLFFKEAPARRKREHPKHEREYPNEWFAADTRVV